MKKIEIYKEIAKTMYPQATEKELYSVARNLIEADERGEDSYCKEHDC